MEKEINIVKTAEPKSFEMLSCKKVGQSYVRIMIDAYIEHPISTKKVVDVLKDEFEIEELKIEANYANISINQK